MTSSPKVLHIVWNLIRGGTEGQCARLAMEMARRGMEQRVAVFRREGYFVDDVERMCGPVHEVAITRMVSSGTWRAVRALADYIRREHIELVHAWDCDATIFGAAAARRAGVPYITSRRDLGDIYPRYKLFLMRRADVGAAAVVVNARAIGTAWAGHGIRHRDVACIQNILDLADFDARAADPFPSETALPSGRFVGLVARLDPEKDIETVVQTAALVCAAREDVSFVVAGDGVERGRMEALVRGAGLTGRVILLGDVTGVPALCRRMSVGMLLPRANEGLSNTILEYMAAGLPVVATDCGGNGELVRRGVTGFLVAVGDARAAAEAILRLLGDPDLARTMGAAARDAVERGHRPALIADRFLDLYRRVATA